MVQGMRRGAVRCARSVDELGQFLSRRFRFKRFKFAVRRFRFRLYGEVNPWVLLADGRLEEVNVRNTDRVGNFGRYALRNSDETVEGVYIGWRNADSRYVASVREMSEDARRVEYNDLITSDNAAAHIRGVDTFDFEEARRLYGDGPATAIRDRGKLATNLGNSPGPNYNAHHIIPVELVTESEALRIAIENGFNFNGPINGRWVTRYSSQTRVNRAGQVIADNAGTHASHPAYTEYVYRQLGLVDLSKSPEEITSQVRSICESIGRLIDDNPSMKLNVLFNNI